MFVWIVAAGVATIIGISPHSRDVAGRTGTHVKPFPQTRKGNAISFAKKMTDVSDALEQPLAGLDRNPLLNLVSTSTNGTLAKGPDEVKGLQATKQIVNNGAGKTQEFATSVRRNPGAEVDTRG